MKKLFFIMISAMMFSSLSAAFIPFSYDRTSPLFSSPSSLIDDDTNTPLSVMLDLSSDLKGLSFLSSPLSVTEEAARDMALTLEKKDAEWWKNNPEIISTFSSFDASFPVPTFSFDTEALELWKIREYLSSTFLSSSYGEERRAYVVSVLSDREDVFSDGKKEGDTDLFLSFFGEKVSEGFGWGWSVNLGYDGNDSLFGGGKSTLFMDVRGEIGYAFFMGEKVSVGISGIPSLRVKTYILPSSYALSRLQADILSLFTEDLRFGMGIEVNSGLAYRVNDELSFSLDGRNVPSLYSYWGIKLTDLASSRLNFSRLKDTWIELPDVVLGAHWNRGAHRVDVGMDSIVSQLLWMEEIDGYEFDFLLCPSVKYTYSYNQDKKITAYMENGMISMGIEYYGFACFLSYAFFDANIGVKFGYRI